jgi:LysR family transcriptional regulator for bpeEF and oprC
VSNIRTATDKFASLSVFVAVGTSSSFTAAAQKLQMSVSGVSKAVTRLEERLGSRLVSRTSRRVKLTDEGVAYFTRCQQIMHDLEEAEGMITESSGQPRGRIRVQMPRGLGKKVIVPAIARFLDLYPEVSVDIVLDAMSYNLEEEGIDVAIRYGEPVDSLQIARKLCDVSYLACAAPAYLRHRGVPSTVGDLESHRLVNYIVPGTGRYRRWNFREAGKHLSIDVSGSLNVNDMGALVDATLTGAGIAYVPGFMVLDHLSKGELERVLPDAAFEGQSIYLVYLRRRHASPRLRVLMEFLRDLLTESPPKRSTLPTAKTARRSKLSA